MFSLFKKLFAEEKMFHADPQRFRRSTVASFVGEAVLMVVALFILSFFDSDIIGPVRKIQTLVLLGIIINLSGLIGIITSQNVQRVIGLKALGYSALFIPTLIFTGGFVSPFVVVYL
ncbi:MAG: hypothetical protein ACOC4C_04930, partial [Fibrobacterota bacterium]